VNTLCINLFVENFLAKSRYCSFNIQWVYVCCPQSNPSENIYLVRVVRLYFSERSLQGGKIVLNPLEFLHLGLRVAVQNKNNTAAHSKKSSSKLYTKRVLLFGFSVVLTETTFFMKNTGLALIDVHR
jgi:hypothetical protein